MPTKLEDLCEDVLEVIIKVESDPNPNPMQLYTEEHRIDWQRCRSPSTVSFFSDGGDDSSEHTGQSADGDATMADEDNISESNTSQDQVDVWALHPDDSWAQQPDDNCLQDGVPTSYADYWATRCYVCDKDIDECTKIYAEELHDRTSVVVSRCLGDVLRMESLSIKDILNLRLTSKMLYGKLIDAYRRILKASRVRKTGIVPVWMSYRGLRAFSGLTTNGLVAQNITSLHINVGRLNMRIVRDSLARCRSSHANSKLLDEPLSWDHVKAGLSLEELDCIDTYEKYVEQEWATAAGEDVRLLREAFSRLPNLRNIYVGKLEIPQDVRFPTLTPDIYKPGEECEIRSAALTTIFTALAAQPVPLEDLVIHRESKSYYKPTSEEAGVWALSLPKPLLAQLSPSLSTIKHLHLSLSTGDLLHRGPKTLFKRSVAPEAFTKSHGPQALLAFLSTLPQLTSLHLVAAAQNEFSLSFVRKVLRGLPDTLEELHLSNTMMSVPLLAHFLNAHRHQLTELGLSRLYLVDDNWTTLFRMLQTFMPNLQRVYLEQLWELHPDFADKLFFFAPCGYVGARNGVGLGRRIYAVGAADRCRGTYFKGRWFALFRYDAMVMNDEDTRFKAQSLEGGLNYAIKWSKREAVRYGRRNVDDPLPQKVLEYAAEAFGKTVEKLTAGA
ncbi:hypothetical protein DIS24_g6473 [Lasiodiplodia hormozganensis]|uniref:Uncharacterized protein n=1 Tax=Lasiodiplodia hormozganensis TaxID=869390 RepID=A0AA39YEB9_9PEZI|nr:hypothetical protein DIS24_g6473 [Lasiodiplodia hormozganensis]